MPSHPVKTECGLQQRRDDALKLMRTAEWAAYFQGGLSIVVGVFLALQAEGLSGGIETVLLGVVLVALGFAIGRKHNAIAAAALVAIVLGYAVLQLLAGGRPPALIVVAIFAWIYGKGYNAAREFASLRDVQLESTTPIKPMPPM